MYQYVVLVCCEHQLNFSAALCCYTMAHHSTCLLALWWKSSVCSSGSRGSRPEDKCWFLRLLWAVWWLLRRPCMWWRGRPGCFLMKGGIHPPSWHGKTVGCFCYVLRRLDPQFLCRGESGGGRVVGRMMIGDGMISAICGLHWCLIVIVAVVCSVWIAGGDVSFTGPGCQHAGVPLIVVVGLVAAVGWRGYSHAEGAGCLLLSTPFL